MTRIRKPEKLVTPERLREVLDYNSETGVFVWKKMLSRNVLPGRVAGRTEKTGYNYIRIDENDYLAQRLAWLYVHGRWPTQILRFQDRNKQNCAISNLVEGRYLTTIYDQSAKGKAAWAKARREQHPEVYHRHELKKNFGITLEYYKQMLLDQNGVCACCKKPETATLRGKVRTLCVDHNHETGEIRGLLCMSCNMGIGHARDSVEILESMVVYLKKYAAQPSANIVPFKKKEA